MTVDLAIDGIVGILLAATLVFCFVLGADTAKLEVITYLPIAVRPSRGWRLGGS